MEQGKARNQGKEGMISTPRPCPRSPSPALGQREVGIEGEHGAGGCATTRGHFTLGTNCSSETPKGLLDIQCRRDQRKKTIILPWPALPGSPFGFLPKKDRSNPSCPLPSLNKPLKLTRAAAPLPAHWNDLAPRDQAMFNTYTALSISKTHHTSPFILKMEKAY